MKKAENIRALHFLRKGLSFPVVVYEYNDWEDVQVTYLSTIVKEVRMTTLNICRWCENHNISYIVIYPRNILKLMIEDPKRFFCYIYLQRQGVKGIRM